MCFKKKDLPTNLYLLSQSLLIRHKSSLRLDLVFVGLRHGLEVLYIPSIEGLEHLNQPCTFRALEYVQDWVQQEFSELIDLLSAQRRQSKVEG